MCGESMRAHLLDQTLDTRARVCWWARRVAVAPEVQQEHVVTVGITKGRGGAQPAAVRLKPAMKENDPATLDRARSRAVCAAQEQIKRGGIVGPGGRDLIGRHRFSNIRIRTKFHIPNVYICIIFFSVCSQY